MRRGGASPQTHRQVRAGEIPPFLCDEPRTGKLRTFLMTIVKTRMGPMTNTYQHHYDAIAQFDETTAIEIRFHVRINDYRNYQLLGTVSPNGAVQYTLHRNPRGHHSESISNLVGRDATDVTLPMKAYKGWQADLLAWVASLSNHKGDIIYIVDEVY